MNAEEIYRRVREWDRPVPPGRRLQWKTVWNIDRERRACPRADADGYRSRQVMRALFMS
jgi:hypothetical protein